MVRLTLALSAQKWGIIVVSSAVGTVGEHCLYLPVRGPVRLVGPAGRHKLRRRSLAILYYLALEGSTRRERLADLLWETADPLSNLRVELNALNVVLRDSGLKAFPAFQDPLQLPEGLKLDLQSGSSDALLEGFESIGSDFQEWLNWKRTRLKAAVSSGYDNSALLDTLAAGLKAPYLLVIEPEPFGVADDLVEALARRLALPLLPLAASGAGLRHVQPPYAAGLVDRILEDDGSIWVFERPFFGPDPSELLELRYRLPAARTSYVKLPVATWLAARGSKPLKGLDFVPAARLFLASCGHPGYLAEAADYIDQDPLPVPQKYRAAVELELRKLRPECRQLLQTMVVSRRLTPGGGFEQLQTEECVAELVNNGWLEFNGEDWGFRSAFIRCLVYDCLPEGVRQSYHRKRSNELAKNGHTAVSQLHLYLAGEPTDKETLLGLLSGWARELVGGKLGVQTRKQPVSTSMVSSAAEDSFLELTGKFGSGVEQVGNAVAIVRLGQETVASGVTLAVPNGPVLLKLEGQSYIRNVMGIGFGGKAVPLAVRFDGIQRIVMAPDLPAGMHKDGLLLPLPEQFEYWFVCPAASEITIESQSERGVIQLDAQVYARVESGVQRAAFALEA